MTARSYRRRELACPVERCGRAFHADDAQAAAAHIGAPHTVCACGWVGVSYPAHLRKVSHGQASEAHHRTAVVRAKTAAPVGKVTTIRRRRSKSDGPRGTPEVRPNPATATLDEAWDVILALSVVDRGRLAHELAEGLERDDPMPRAWSR